MKTNKKSEEKLFADFFIEHFNKRYGLEYSTNVNDKEDSVDVYAKAKGLENLYLQIKTGEPELEAFWGSRAKQGSGMVSIEHNIPEFLNYVVDKAHKKYSNRSELVLLVGEKMQPAFDPEFAKFIANPFIDSGFKGVYIVKLPFESCKPPYQGQIVSLKDVKGNHGEVF